MGRTNDAILYGGRVHITVQGGDGDAEGLANGLPSSCSGDYGKPFAETFASYGGDFYAIDPLLFSPAEVIVTARDSGASFHAGGVDGALVDLSFGHG
jgi:methenyltetrahydromethanopterin cyclohydrolase